MTCVNADPPERRPPAETVEAAERELAARFATLRDVLRRKMEFDSGRATLDRARKRARADGN